MMRIFLHFLWIFGVLFVHTVAKKGESLTLLTVASDKTDGFHRYLRSTQVNSLEGKALGLGEPWKGGNMDHPGGGYKVNLLKKEIDELVKEGRKDLVVLFSDSYDVLLLKDAEFILSTFREMDADVVFGAESFCWPDQDLASHYPSSNGYRFLNSGAFIGYASVLQQILNLETIKDTDDDQRYYTKMFLEFGKKLNIKLDHSAKLFQNLNGAVADVELRFDDDGIPFLYNLIHNTEPALVHGNGPSKVLLNNLGNYLPKAWNKVDQCTSCLEDVLDKETTPLVVMGIFIEKPTPFLEEFLEKIKMIDYPKNRLDVLLFNLVPYHDDLVDAFVKDVKDHYNNFKITRSCEKSKIWRAKNEALARCKELDECKYFFNVDSDSHMDDPKVLKSLIRQNRPILGPMLVRPYKAWSNFWGALSSEGFYARSTDYMELINSNRRGVWNVPYLTSTYLIQREVLDAHPDFNYINKLLDADMAFSANARNRGIFMYVTNREELGHLVDVDDFVIDNTETGYNELWEIINNRYDWERRYIHENYSKNFDEVDFPYTQPCPDVYNFPTVSTRFAKEFIAVMEGYGKWSDGSNQDSRLDGGYEAVPTRDIHMNQVNFEQEWLYFLRTYVMPLQQHVFVGYYNDPPKASMNFIVRYKPEEQPSLKLHHDSSTYTINIALNDDYEGGGCRFFRYNCSVIKNKIGWMTIHPGRLTHFHEGLETTKGTRYIMISFVDP